MIASVLDQYQRPVFAYLAHLVDDREWAEELAEDALRAALRAGHQLPGIPGRRAWFFRIATKTAFDALRRRHRFGRLTRHDTDRLSRPASDRRDWMHQSAVERALRALPAEDRAPLLLYSQCGLSLAEVAEVLGAGEDAVKQRLHRSRALFRAAYEREAPVDRPR